MLWCMKFLLIGQGLRSLLDTLETQAVERVHFKCTSAFSFRLVVFEWNEPARLLTAETGWVSAGSHPTADRSKTWCLPYTWPAPSPQLSSCNRAKEEHRSYRTASEVNVVIGRMWSRVQAALICVKTSRHLLCVQSSLRCSHKET